MPLLVGKTLVSARAYAPCMWESPAALWGRLKLGREEYLQRLLTTLILDGEAPRWNTPRSPGAAGRRFLQYLDEAVHGPRATDGRSMSSVMFIDEYLLPRLEEHAANGWPDWAVLSDDRLWIVELKTEAGSHREEQLPYYLKLGAAAHPRHSLDLTYITGPLTKPAPALLAGQRYSHITWREVLPLVEGAWAIDQRAEVRAYVEMVAMIVGNLNLLKPTEQRRQVLGLLRVETTTAMGDGPTSGAMADPSTIGPLALLRLARATALDGRQRGIGAQDPEALEAFRDQAIAEIDTLPPADTTRFVLPWLWRAGRTDGRALTAEGEEFGLELRFSRYKKIQVGV